MRRVSNTNSLRIGIFGTWYSLWYDKEYYTFLVYKDYKLIEFLNSIFYRLRIPTNHFYLNRINNNYYFIESNLYLTKPSFNKFTKLLYYNKLIFRYISLLEYLFDFSLLVSNNLIKDKNYIENELKSKNFLISSFYYFFYSLYNMYNTFTSNNYLYNYYYINILYLNYIKNNKDIIRFTKFHNKLNLFTNSFNINNKNIYNKLKLNNLDSVNKIKFFLINFFSLNSYKNKYIYFYNNLNFFLLKKKIILFFFNFFSKFLLFYFILFKNVSKTLDILNFYFLDIYYKFYFLFKKNIIINNYKLNLIKNIKFNYLNTYSENINISKKKSNFSYNINYNSNNSRDFYKNKHYINYKFNNFLSSSLNNNYGFISFFYIKNFNLLIKELSNNSIKISREIVDMVHYKKINKLNLFQKRIINFFKTRFFFILNFFLESTIFKYTGLNCFFFMTLYVKNFPNFDSKLISDYICFNLKRKHRITRVFNKISQMQRQSNNKAKKIFIPLFNELNSMNINLLNKKYISYFNYNNLFNIVFFNKIYNKDLLKKFNPVSGIRIEFSGPPKKAQMSKTVAYHNIVHDYKLVGKMPTHTVYADIHYYQSYVRLKRSTFGIKVWLFFHTRILNKNNVNKSMI